MSPSFLSALRVACLAGALAWTGAAPAATHATPDEMAACVAAMQVQAEEWAAAVRAGDAGLEKTLLAELERASALMGRSYLDGAHDEADAKARLKAARDAQAGWPREQREALRLSCDARANAELAASNFLQRALVQRMARKRLQTMLKPQP